MFTLVKIVTAQIFYLAAAQLAILSGSFSNIKIAIEEIKTKKIYVLKIWREIFSTGDFFWSLRDQLLQFNRR